MRKICFIIVLLASVFASAQTLEGQSGENRKWTNLQQYADSLQELVNRYHIADSLAAAHRQPVATNPYFFPLFATATLYNRPLQQSMAIQWVPGGALGQNGITGFPLLQDGQLTAVGGVNEQLAQMYVRYPYLFAQTQQQLMEQGVLLPDIEKPIKSDTKFSDQIELSEMKHDVHDTIMAITRRPNFWTLKGSTSLQFTQSYFSDNWFQGGDNNYSALALLTFEANYDNKRKIQWENKLEMQLGFQTAKADTLHSLRVTSNLLRFTTKLGYRAAKSWYYTTQFQASTQLYPNYNTNTNVVTTDFLSPLHTQLSVGMDYKLNKKRFNGSLYLSPLSVNARYVDRHDLRSRYNDSERQATKWTWGPNVTINFTWKMFDNISWQSRMYWFSDFKYTNVEWENTFTFSINKFLTCKLFAYPKFLDNNMKFRNEHGKYWMFKEWLSLGVSYNW